MRFQAPLDCCCIGSSQLHDLCDTVQLDICHAASPAMPNSTVVAASLSAILMPSCTVDTDLLRAARQEWRDWEESIWKKFAIQAPRKAFAAEMAAQLKWLLQQVH